jgi:WD40 repeat protein
MRLLRGIVGGLSILAAGLTSVLAQKPPQPAALPPINPAIAKLDQTSANLDAPGTALAAREAGDLLLAAGEGHTLSYWLKDGANPLRVADVPGHVLKGHTAPVTAVVAAGPTVASAAVDGQVLLWSLPGDKITHRLKAPAAVRCLALTADGKTLASAGDDGAVQLWDASGGQPTRKLTGPTDWLLALAFSPDGKTMAAGGYDGKLRVWDVASGKKLVEVLAGPPAPPKGPPPATNIVSAVAFSPDGKTLAVGGHEGRIDLFQANDGKFLRSLAGHVSAVTALVFHPSGNVLVSASKDRTIRLWNPANAQLLKALEGHTAWVQGVAFLDQGTRLASVGADHTVRLWNLTEPVKKK